MSVLPRRFATRAAAVFFAAWLPVHAASLRISSDVESPLTNESARSKAFQGNVEALGDHGSVAVLRVDGDYDRGQVDARAAIGRRFYETHADDYDFLIAFTAFEFETGDALAFYQPILNDVDGIGQPRFDYSSLYGSAGRLQGYVDMAALTRYDLNRRSPAYRVALSTLAHEIMHRWGVGVRFRDSDGVLRTDLLGSDAAHWSWLASTEASVMYGARWQESSTGEWLAVEVGQRLSWWDLYLAGFADAGEVASVTLLQSGAGGADTPVQVGQHVQASATTIAPSQVFEAEGPRLPSAELAPRQFNAALLLLLRPGQSLSSTDLARLDQFRHAFESYFSAITRGRATIRLHLRGAENPAQGEPAMLVGSPLQPQANAITAAQSWLQSQQRDDGRWEDRPGSAVRDTTAALELLAESDAGEAARALGRQWLEQRDPRNLDERAWKQYALPHAPVMTSVALNADGGQGLLDDWPSSPIDGLRSWSARSRLTEPQSSAIERLAARITMSQNADGSFAPSRAGAGRLGITAALGERLILSSRASDRVAGVNARHWVEARLQASISEPGALALADVAELSLRAPALGLGDTTRAALVQQLLARQGSLGDWSGSVYTTATAALALLRETSANLVALNASAQPVQPLAGETLRPSVRVANRGGQASVATTMRWYLGDPDQGGTPLGDPLPVRALLAGEELDVDAVLDTSMLLGQVTLIAVLDPDDLIEESREDDNRVALTIVLQPAPTGAELALDASEIAFEPAQIASIPGQANVAGVLRNFGLTGATQVEVRAYRIVPEGVTTLGGVRVDVAGRSAAPFAIDFEVDEAAAHRIRLVADPEFEFEETREDNNTAEAVLPYAEAIDLAILPDTLSFEAEAIVGSDTRVSVEVANLGTVDAPTTRVVLEQQLAGEWIERAAAVLSVPRATTLSRSLSWRPSAAGVSSMRLRVDPEGVVAESDEANNEAMFEQTIVADDAAALSPVAGSLVWSPEPLLQGRPATVDVRVRNTGDVATTAFSVAAYLGDPRAQGARIGQIRLEAGIEASVAQTVSIPVPDYPERGDASLYVWVDSESEVAEANELDNLQVSDVTALGLADLVAGASAIELTPALPVVGMSVRAEVLVSNTGEQASAATIVRLSEVAGIERSEVTPAAILPALAPGASHRVVFDWTFGQLPSVQAMHLEIDPANDVREYDEGNNSATHLVELQSGDVYVTEPFFSPNGDGVRDTTRIVVAQGQQAASIAILDDSGRLRRELSQLEPVGNGARAVVWDGRDARGRTAPDAGYRVVVQRGDGSVLGESRVTLDNDLAMALEAAGSFDAALVEFPPGVGRWEPGIEGTATEWLAFGSRGPWGSAPPGAQGIHAIHLLSGRITRPVTERWLDVYAEANDLISLDVSSVAPTPDGRIVFTADEVGGQNRTLVFIQGASEVDAAELLAALDRRYDDMRWSRSNDRMVLADLDSSVLWKLDLHSHQLTELDSPSGNIRQMAVMSSGVLVETGGLYFVPYDTMQPTHRFERYSYSDSGAWQLHWAALPDSDRFLAHRVRADYGDEGARSEHVDIADVLGSEPANVATRVCDYVEPGCSDNADILTFRASWLGKSGELLLIDHQERTASRFDLQGRALSTTGLPASLRGGPYAERFGELSNGTDDSQIVPGELTCNGECSTSTVHGYRLGSETPFERHAWANHDPDADVAYVSVGEIGPEGRHGATDHFAWHADGRVERIGGATEWPLDRPQDIANYPLYIEGGSLGAWPKRIHANGTMLRWDGRIATPRPPALSSAGLVPGFVGSFSASEGRLHLSDNDYDIGFDGSLTTLARSTALIEADSAGRSIRLSGWATDRNLDHYRIDWARLESPEGWNALVPATRETIRGDEFIGWAPPAPGAFLFRLTVVDRAGNQRTSLATADSILSSPIVSVRQDTRHLSPNGDGMKDAVTLSFVVLRPTSQTIEIRTDTGVVVRRAELVYGTVEVGAAAWVWDGRGDDGQTVADGRYRVEFSSGHAVRVDVDTTAPIVTAELEHPFDLFDAEQLADRAPAPLHDVGPLIRHEVDERFAGAPAPLGSLAWETASLDAEDWRAFVPLAQRQHEGVRDEALLSAVQYNAKRFRLVAEDRAGNRTVAAAGTAQPLLSLLRLGDATTSDLPAIVRGPYASTSQIPEYAVGGPDAASGQPAVVPLAMTEDFGVHVVDHAGDPTRYWLDEQVTGPNGLQWQVVDEIVPGTLGDLPLQRQLDGSVHRLGVDLSGKTVGEFVTLRVRSESARVGIRESNAFRARAGGVEFECFAFDGTGGPGGLGSQGSAFSLRTIVAQPASVPRLEIGVRLGASGCEGPQCYRTIASVAPGPDLSLLSFQFTSFQELRQQFGYPDSTTFVHRVSVTDGTGVSRESAWDDCRSDGYAIKVLPTDAPSCGTEPSGQVEVQLAGRFSPEIGYRLRVLSTTGHEVALIPLGPTVPENYRLDTTSLGQGTHFVSLQLLPPGSEDWIGTGSAQFIVDHESPLIELQSPLAGERVCQIDAEPRLTFSIEDDWRIGHASIFTSGESREIDCFGIEFADENAYCGNGARDIPRAASFDRSGPVWTDSELPPWRLRNGPTSIQVAALDWSGAKVCAQVEVDVDADVQIDLRGLPTPGLPGPGGQVGLSPASDGQFAEVRFPFLARERVDWSVDLYRAQPARAGEPARIEGSPLATLRSPESIVGDFDFTWDGYVAGSAVPDGFYGLRVEATDDCGNVRYIDRFVVIDATAPELHITAPLDGAEVRAAVVSVIGLVEDQNLLRYEVGISTSGPAGPWIRVGGDTRQMTSPEPLAHWITGGYVGPAWLRLEARDRLENASTRVHAIELMPRAALLTSAGVQPWLFSPGDDGNKDLATIALSLAGEARVEIHVRGAGGQLLRTLEAGRDVNGGSLQTTWDGRDASGQIAPDADYEIEVLVSDPAQPGNVDEQRLPVRIDATAPRVHDIAPEDAHVRCDEGLGFGVEDAHVERVRARLLHLGTEVSDYQSDRAGEHRIAEFSSLSEGGYRASIAVDDLAGNHSEVELEFDLDCSAPSAELSLPDVVARRPGEPVAINGRASDTNFAGFRIELAPVDDPDAVSVLHESSVPVDDGLLHSWQPTQWEDNYVMRLVVVDRAGNENQREHELYIDATPPDVEIDLPTMGARIGRRFEVIGTATDATAETYRIEIATPSQAAVNLWSTIHEGFAEVEDDVLGAIELPFDGPLALRVSATDAAGWSAHARVDLVIDDTPPLPLVLSGEILPNSNVRLDWTSAGDSDLAEIRVLRNGILLDTLAGTATSYLDSDAPEGAVRFQVVAVDLIGLVGAASNEVVLESDRSAPTVELRVRPGERIRAGFPIVGSVKTDRGDLEAWRLELERSPDPAQLLQSGASEITGGLLHLLETHAYADEQPLVIRLTARDTRGNVAEQSREVVVDNAAPAAPYGLTATDAVDAVTLQWTPNVEADLLGYLLYRGGQLVGTSGPLPADLRDVSLTANLYVDVDAPDGALSYRVYAIDQAGNISAASMPAELLRDSGPPSLEIVQPLSGARIGAAVEVVARSADRDIASVAFAYRSGANGPWTAIGAPVAQEPWRASFDPAGLDHGAYQLRAVATDAGGAFDPAPPVVSIIHSDLTAPAQPQGVIARAEGAAVRVRWTPNAEADLAAYRIERQEPGGAWAELAVLSAATIDWLDASRPLGTHRYRVVAIDAQDNESPASAPDTAQVFGLEVVQPYTPTLDAAVGVGGRSTTHGGVVLYSVRREAEVVLGEGGMVGVSSEFVLDAVPLFEGLNEIEVTIRDALGNVSVPGHVRVRRTSRPLAPTDLAGTQALPDVLLEWQPSPSPQVIGYRVHRNGRVLVPDAALSQSTTAVVAGLERPELVDGDVGTGQAFVAPLASPRLESPARLDVQWAAPAIVAGVRLEYAHATFAARSWRLRAWNAEAGWITLIERDGREVASEVAWLPEGYATTSLRFELLGAQAPAQAIDLREIVILERLAAEPTNAMDAPGDGRHAYHVTALDAFGFASPPSNEWVASIGDAESPEPVVATGRIENGAAVVEWSASPSADVVRYAVHRNGERIATYAATDPRILVDDDLPDGSYRYVVVAEDGAFNRSVDSNEVELTLASDAPEAPSIVSVEQVAAEESLHIAWQPNGQMAVRYWLYTSRAEDDPAQPFTLLLQTAATAYTHAGIGLGRHWYRVQAEDARGNRSPMSAAVAGDVRPMTGPLPPVFSFPTIAGVPIEWDEPRFDVCGSTSPGATVIVANNGVVVGEAEASDAMPPRGLHFARGPEVAMGVDGNSVFVLNGVGAAHGWLDFDGQSVGEDSEWSGSSDGLRLTPDGRWMFAIRRPAGTVGRWRLDMQPSQYTGFGDFANLVEAIPAPDGQSALITQRTGAQPARLKLVRPGEAPIEIPIPLGAELRDGSITWLGDGVTAYAARQDGTLLAIDVDAETVTALPGRSDGIGPFPAPSGEAWLAVDAAQRQIRLHADGDDFGSPWLDDGRLPLALSWSPDGSSVAVLFVDAIEFRRAEDGVLQQSLPLTGSMLATGLRLRWPHRSRLLLVSSDPQEPARLIDVPGAFCLQDIVAVEGANLIEAVAENEHGLLSAAAEPIRIDYEPDSSVELPNLVAADDSTLDIRLFPVAPQPQDRVIAIVRVRNDGELATWSGRLLTATVRSPDGSERPVVREGMQTIEAWSSSTFALDLGRVEQTGPHLLRVDVDPDDVLAESDESDNRGTLLFDVGGSLAPRLTFVPWITQAVPGEFVEGDLEVTTLGPPRALRLKIDVIDSDGGLVHAIIDESLPAMSSGQRRSYAWYWDIPVEALADDYVLRAQALDVDGTIVSQASLPVEVTSEVDFSLVLQPDRMRQTLGESLPIEIGFDYIEGARYFPNATMALNVRHADGEHEPIWQGSSGAILPGYAVRRRVVFSGSQQREGWATLEFRLTVDGIDYVSERQIELVASGTTPVLSGTMALAPSPQWSLGAPAAFDLRLRNDATTMQEDTRYRVQVHVEGTAAPIGEYLGSVDLAASTVTPLTVPATGLPEQARPHVARLDAQLASDPPGSWRRLATLPFAAVDAMPPALEVLLPAVDDLVRMPSLLVVRAADRHSAVQRVEYRVDGGAWRPMGSGGLEGYEASLYGLADGQHVLSIRATDQWGNLARVDAHRIEVDSTPPRIEIDGIEHGGLYNEPVAATVVSVDNHPLGFQGWIDGVAYASATPFATEGEHQLHVIAHDGAGNRSEARLDFVIDRTSPGLAIVTPTTGTSTRLRTIAMQAQTEAGASVRVQVGAHQAEASADVGGLVHFAAVPLQTGSNTLRVVATDAAGNDSPERSVVVEREPLPGLLAGDVVPSSDPVPRGETLDVTLFVDNGTDADFAPLPLRLRAIAPGAVLLYEEPLAISLVSGEIESIERALDTATWPWGPVTLVLDVDEGSGWRELHAATIQVSDASAPLIAWLLPQPAALVANPSLARVQANDDRAIASVELRVGAGTWQSMASVGSDVFEQPLDLEDGSQPLQARARDAAGNEALSDVRTVMVDGTPPQLSFAGAADGEAYGEAVRVRVDVIDAHPGALELTLDGAPYVADAEIATDGMHHIEARAVDQAGNEAVASIRFEIDRTAPTLEVLQPTSGAIVAVEHMTMIGTSEPEASIDLALTDFSATVQADGSGAFSFTQVPLALGENRLVLTATDRVGNASAPLEVAVFRSDSGPIGLNSMVTPDPSNPGESQAFSIDYRIGERAGLARSPLTARLQIRSASSGAVLQQRELALPLSAFGEATGSESFLGGSLPLGAHSVVLEASHQGTWQELGNAALTVRDDRAPVVQFVAPAPGSLHGASLEVIAGASDQSIVELVQMRVAGGPWQALTTLGDDWIGNVSLELEGELLLELRARDVHGNQSLPVQRTVRSDQTAPQILVNGFSDGQRGRDPVTPVIQISDASNVEVGLTLDGGPFQSGTTVTEEGEHVLDVEALDEVGLRSQVTMRFTIDRTAPPIAIAHPVSGAQIQASQVEVLGMSDAAARIELSWSGGLREVSAGVDGSFAFAGVTLEPGQNLLRLRALDDLGNASDWLELSVLRVCGGQDLSCSIFSNGFESSTVPRSAMTSAAAKGLAPQGAVLIPVLDHFTLLLIGLLVGFTARQSLRSARSQS